MFTHASSRPTSWLITISPPLWDFRKSRSHTIESASRWLVGSSSSSVSAPENRIRASSTRRRWPPERAQRLVEDPVLDAEAGGDLGGLGVRGVAAPGVQLGVGALVAAHAALVDRGVVGAHVPLGLPEPPYHLVQAARGEDPVAGEHVGVAGARVLRQVADAAGGDDLAGRGQRVPGEDLGERGLAGAVAADEADLVAGGDAEADVLHQQACARADLELVCGDHVTGILGRT